MFRRLARSVSQFGSMGSTHTMVKLRKAKERMDAQLPPRMPSRRARRENDNEQQHIARDEARVLDMASTLISRMSRAQAGTDAAPENTIPYPRPPNVLEVSTFRNRMQQQLQEGLASILDDDKRGKAVTHLVRAQDAKAFK